MYYSIGDVSNNTGIAISTLRYYDREGLFPNIGRSSGGIRVFSDTEIEAIKIIECLKNSGLSIKDIKKFLDWCQEGDSSLQKRRDMFYERLEVVKKQMEELEKTMKTIKYKCWYYDTALAAGTEEAMKGYGNIIAITKTDSLWFPVADFADTCSWDACARMAAFMRDGKFDDWEKIFVAKKDDVFMGFCALIKPQKFPGMEYTPLIKWLFVAEQYRGQRLSQKLLEAAAEYAKEIGFDAIYLTTWHKGLYEKYGFMKICDKEVRDGYFEGVYEKKMIKY